MPSANCGQLLNGQAHGISDPIQTGRLAIVCLKDTRRGRCGAASTFSQTRCPGSGTTSLDCAFGARGILGGTTPGPLAPSTLAEASSLKVEASILDLLPQLRWKEKNPNRP